AVPVEPADVAGHPRARIVLGVGRPGYQPSGEELRVVHEREAQHVDAGRDGQDERGEQDGPHAGPPGERAAAEPPLPPRDRRARDDRARARPPCRDSFSTNVCTRAIDSTRATRITATAEAMPMWFSSKASR